MKCLILLAIFFLVGCSALPQTERAKTLETYEKKAVERCFELGGMPMFSARDGKFNDCQFKYAQ